ncbi:2-hydroxychromene-2-carboxylate isomerase [Oleomonas cavernae]|uniref:2-hydroxychromene-2-carboxylate isomerase n=1 Tax=Oleomonas cavernae TaxID=2320859 RepID=A0A418WD45_9PROT|nr:DsbA family protein [Oleomonas cavernae]RJF87920.1 2-hydroxychromene-2-carboxylate isomerase [Oleomonas cavernae]
MSLRSVIAPVVSTLITSERLRARRAGRAEKLRARRGRPHEIHYFHQVEDPYSLLAAGALPALAARAGVEIVPHLVPPPPDWAAPERRMLETFARRDAADLAGHLGLAGQDFGRPPAPAQAHEAAGKLAAAIAEGRFVADAAAITAATWGGAAVAAPAADPTESLRAGDALRQELGHYLGATFHYAGEWYWGLDRLHYLESRLDGLDARRRDGGPSPQFPRTRLRLMPELAGRLAGRPLELFFSFRSPYSYIVLPRVYALAAHYGAELRLRFVLPMVTRGLPVPAAKRLYIVRDTKREAVSEGLPFGRIVDPLGKAVERGLAILHHAVGQGPGAGQDFALSFLSGVFADGIDAASDKGLRQIVERAGLDWAVARPAMASDAWRGTAEVNRQAMIDLGLWGVPSLRFGEVSTWGQDRLWRIEAAMIDAAANL